MNQDIKFKMIDTLKGRGAYSHSINNKQHYTRCPFCGDSLNLSHAHLSIKIDVESDEPMLYRCLKCSASGIVNETLLDELDLCIDNDAKKELKIFNKRSMRIHKYVNNEIEHFVVPTYQDNYLNELKLNYLNNRIGSDLNYMQIQSKKILLNVFDFMKINELKSLGNLSYSMMKNLNENYIGFLSCNNNCIVFRDITGKQKYRYFKVIINDKNLNQDTFYSIPNSIPLMYTNQINVHIAEGTFDIISIQENLIKTNEFNYFYAMCGFGGIVILKYLLHHGINTGINLHIYSDKDKSDYSHLKYLNKLYITEWIDNIYIHRNQYKAEKDYGVEKDKIIDSYRKIK